MSIKFIRIIRECEGGKSGNLGSLSLKAIATRVDRGELSKISEF